MNDSPIMLPVQVRSRRKAYKNRHINRMQAIKQELLKFCKTTSLRGIPRIIKADGICLKLVWTIFVSLLVCGCLTNLFLIIQQYLAFDVIHLPSRKYMPDATFPSFTICNQKPLSEVGKRLIIANNWRPPNKFWNALKDTLRNSTVFALVDGDRKKTRAYQSYANALMTLTGYWSNLPNNTDASKLGLAKNSLIQQCYVMGVNRKKDPPIYYNPCSRMGKWIRIHDASRLNCYMYTPNTFARKEALEIEVIVFLDHDLDSACVECMLEDTSTQMGGARVVLHELDTFPDVTKEGFNVMPGTLTEVKFEPVIWKKLTPPHGVCSAETPTTIKTGTKTFAYNSKNCDRLNKQKEIVKKCNCQMPTLPELPAEKGGKLSHTKNCFRIGSINNFTEFDLFEATQNIRCATLIEYGEMGESNSPRQFFGRVDDRCPNPCQYLSYEETVTQAEWPRKEYHMEFATRRLKSRKEHSEMYNVYKELDSKMEKVEKSNISLVEKEAAIRELKVKLHALGIISRNFLTLKFTRKDYYVKEMQEKPVRTLAGTLSQVGGLFSMWIGLTLIWIVELVDLMIRVARIICGHRYPADREDSGEHNGNALRLPIAQQDLDDPDLSPIIPVPGEHPHFQFQFGEPPAGPSNSEEVAELTKQPRTRRSYEHSL